MLMNKTFLNFVKKKMQGWVWKNTWSVSVVERSNSFGLRKKIINKKDQNYEIIGISSYSEMIMKISKLFAFPSTYTLEGKTIFT